MGEIHRKSLHGMKVDPAIASIIVILSVFLPGISTIIAGLLCRHISTDKKIEVFKTGIIQFVLLTFGMTLPVAWLWSLKWATELKA